jgi:glycosyltransferase involved in cell wall biosynthesis
MSSARLTYAVVTPARNEAENLARLADSLAAQTVEPAVWIVVDDASTDETARVVGQLGETRPWIRLARAERDEGARSGRGRGASVVPAFHSGLHAIHERPDVVAKIDADVTLEPEYFQHLLEAFAEDPTLGIASGSCFEMEDDHWRRRHQTGVMVWGAARAYRWTCLEQVLPLEARMGWDGIDVAKANVKGWRTAVFLELPFYHHRIEAGRERTRWHAWAVQGEACHYMGYRPSYLLLRTLHVMRRDPAAIAMLWSFVASKAKGASTCPDQDVRRHIRRMQRLRDLPARRREAAGARTETTTS